MASKNSCKLKHSLFFIFMVYGMTVIAQDECPSFKVGRKKINLTFVPKFKKKEVHVKFTPTIILGLTGGISGGSREYKTVNGDTTYKKESSFSFYDKSLNKNYLGYALQVSVEKRLKKKSTLEYTLGFEHVLRFTFPDTNRFKYSHVDMKQFYFGENGQNRANFDQIDSKNVRLGLNYRYYFFKKVYKGVYIGPSVQICIGQNKYSDLDEYQPRVNLKYKETNLSVGLGASMGYQMIIKKHFVIDPTMSMIFRQGFGFNRKFEDASASNADITSKYPNTVAKHQVYNPGYYFGIGLGYKFL